MHPADGFHGPAARLREWVRAQARLLGDPALRTFTVVRTTRRLMDQALEFAPQPNDHPERRVYVVELRGRFVCGECSRPYRASPLRGHVAAFVLSVPDLALTDFTIGPRAFDMARMGRVWNLEL
ncbi:MAG: hypothetical protein ACXVY5_10650 [Gaiellales bacterium]